MEPLAIAAAVAVVGGGLLVAGASRRLALVTGVLLILVMLPITGRPFPTTAGWTLGAYLHLTATLLGALFLWIGLRPTGPRVAEPPWLGRGSWLVIVGAAGAIGVLAWPLFIESLDPSRTLEARSAGWIDAPRWAFGAGLAVVATAVSQLLDTIETPRLASGAALAVAGAWLIVLASGVPVADVTLVSVGLVLPMAASVAAWQSVRRD